MTAHSDDADDCGGEDAGEVYDPTVKCGQTIRDTTSSGDEVGRRRGIRLTSLLGTGTYGAVYRGEDTATGEAWAVKALWKAGLDAEQLRLQRLELEINERIAEQAQRGRHGRARRCHDGGNEDGCGHGHHPNIVPMRFHLEDEECLYIAMDLHEGTDLYDAVQDLGGLDDELTKHVFGQVLDAVEFAHGCGVFHRDLKPENVLITQDWRCKLCDWGLSSMETVTAELGCGSAPYMAPEARGGLRQEVAEYSCKEADVWSLGVLLINILFACNPWKAASDADASFAAFVSDPTVLKRQFALSDRAFELLNAIFQLDPALRPTIPQIRAELRAIPHFVDPLLAESSAAAAVLSSSPTDVMAARPGVAAAADAAAESDDSDEEQAAPLDYAPATASKKRAGLFENLFQQFTLSEESTRTPSTAIAVC